MSARRQQPAEVRPANKKGRSVFMRFLRGLAMFIDLVAVGLLLLTGYSGMVSPLSHSAWWGVMPLAFPIVFWIVAVLLCIQLLWFWRGALVLFVGMVVCAGPVLDYFPLHMLQPKAPVGAEEFTLLTYNTHSDTMVDVGKTDLSDYILARDADIICTQEAYMLAYSRREQEVQQRVDSLRIRYPYILFGGKTGGQGILSKYPVENIHLDVSSPLFNSGDVAAYRITLPTGRRICIFNVHLRSFGLTNTPLREASENRAESEEVIAKLMTASVDRARQVNKIVQWLRLYGGPDVIICGDFNDVQGCHAIHTFADVGFKSVYPEIGFGPMTTYNAKHLYYCIDHVLYRGDLKPLWLKKGTLKASDHYPLEVCFAISS